MNTAPRARSRVFNKTATGPLRPVAFFFLAFVLCATTGGVTAAPVNEVRVSIIIDDLGKQLQPGLRTLALPGAVSCAFLPHAARTRELAERAHRRGKEVLLHLPMDSVDGRRLDDGGLTLDMSERQLEQVVRHNLSAVPHVRGVNNHMGSLLTRHPGHMLWLMQVIRDSGDLYFVDSRTTVATVARRLAREVGVPNLERDVFLDNNQDSAAIRGEFERLLALARQQGYALAIGHPYPQTLSILEELLPQLPGRGVRLVPVSELIYNQKKEGKTWQASWSPSHRAARSLKR